MKFDKLSSVAVFDQSTDGHRDNYLSIFSQLLGAKALIGFDLFFSTWSYQKVVFVTIDDYFLRFFLMSLFRSLAGKVTFGVSLRGEVLTQKITWQRFVKRILFRILFFIPKVQCISITAHDHLPGLKKYFKNWIYDLQLWDLKLWQPQPPSSRAVEIQSEINDLARGRKVILALGRQDWQKGTDFFSDLAAVKDLEGRFFFAMVGQIRDVAPEAIAKMKRSGGLVIDQYLSESDLLWLYNSGDLIWCCYHPDYDANSGIFGRALQKGRIPILRLNSLIDKTSQSLGAPVIRIEYENIEFAKVTLGEQLNRGLEGTRPTRLDGFSQFKTVFESEQ